MRRPCACSPSRDVDRGSRVSCASGSSEASRPVHVSGGKCVVPVRRRSSQAFHSGALSHSVVLRADDDPREAAQVERHLPAEKEHVAHDLVPDLWRASRSPEEHVLASGRPCTLRRHVEALDGDVIDEAPRPAQAHDEPPRASRATATGTRIFGVRKRITTSMLMCLPLRGRDRRAEQREPEREARREPAQAPESISSDAFCSQLRRFEKYSTPAFTQSRATKSPRSTATVTTTPAYRCRSVASSGPCRAGRSAHRCRGRRRR